MELSSHASLSNDSRPSGSRSSGPRSTRIERVVAIESSPRIRLFFIKDLAKNGTITRYLQQPIPPSRTAANQWIDANSQHLKPRGFPRSRSEACCPSSKDASTDQITRRRQHLTYDYLSGAHLVGAVNVITGRHRRTPGIDYVKAL